MIERIDLPTIVTKSYELDYSENPGDREKTDREVQQNAGDLNRGPIVWLNGLQIEPSSIETIILNNNTYLPKVTIVFVDPTGKLCDENFPLDNSTVSIYKGSPSPDSPFYGIKMDFKITDFNIIKGREGQEDLKYEIDAIIDINDFYLNDFESYGGTSFDVLRKLAKEMGLGFVTNITNTNDNMIWINPSNYRIEFLKNIVKNSYVDDETFLFGYVDFQYNFNIIDINKQLESDISNQMNLVEESMSDNLQEETALILSNHPDETNSNMHIKKFTLLNSSTNVNLTYGYKNKLNTFNIIDKKMNKYDLDAITTDDENSIVLKDSEDNELYDNMVVNEYLGKYDINNCHKNYIHTQFQNEFNLKFLQKLKMKIKMAKPNYGLYRFQKVTVEIYNLNKPDNTEKDIQLENDGKDIKRLSRQHDDKINNKLSGDWLITAIDMKFSGQGKGVEQEITLVKRELTNKYNFDRREKIKNA
jgi:hypothetical protein